MAYIKRNYSQFNKNEIEILSKDFDMPTEIIELLFSRGIDNKEKLYSFLNPSYDDFSDPFLLNNMDEVVKRLRAAIRNK